MAHPVRQLEDVRLLAGEQGRIVWRTFRARWLVGTSFGASVMGFRAGESNWCVLQGASGKFVVYEYQGYKSPGRLTVYENLDGMEDHIPASVFEKAGAAGLREPAKDPYPVEPLDV